MCSCIFKSLLYTFNCFVSVFVYIVRDFEVLRPCLPTGKAVLRRCAHKKALAFFLCESSAAPSSTPGCVVRCSHNFFLYSCVILTLKQFFLEICAVEGERHDLLSLHCHCCLKLIIFLDDSSLFH